MLKSGRFKQERGVLTKIPKINKRGAIIWTWRVRASHLDFITKELSNAIIPRSKLCNLYFKVRSDENRARYKKQMNICVLLLKKAK